VTAKTPTPAMDMAFWYVFYLSVIGLYRVTLSKDSEGVEPPASARWRVLAFWYVTHAFVGGAGRVIWEASLPAVISSLRFEFSERDHARAAVRNY